MDERRGWGGGEGIGPREVGGVRTEMTATRASPDWSTKAWQGKDEQNHMGTKGGFGGAHLEPLPRGVALAGHLLAAAEFNGGHAVGREGGHDGVERVAWETQRRGHLPPTIGRSV